MEPRIQNGDYIPDGLGGVVRSQGADALLERVLFRLTARRGGLPPLPQLGSRLYLLGREPAAQRPRPGTAVRRPAVCGGGAGGGGCYGYGYCVGTSGAGPHPADSSAGISRDRPFGLISHLSRR